jgi:hypothetical protein
MLRVEVFDHTGDGFKGRPKGPSVGFLVADGDRIWAEPPDDRHLRKVLRHGMVPGRRPVKSEADLRLLVERGGAMPHYEVREMEEPQPTVIVQAAEDGGDDLDDDDDDLLDRLLWARLNSQERPEEREEILRARRQDEESGQTGPPKE